MSMWKYIFYPLMLLLLWHSNNLLADETDQKNEADQTLYVNVLDPNSNFEQNLLNAYYGIKAKDLGISLQPISPAGFAEKAYKLTRCFTTKDNTNIKEQYILRLFYSTTLYNKDVEVNITEIPIYSTAFSNYLHIKITDKTQSDLVKEGMLPFINKKSLLLLRDKPDYSCSDDEANLEEAKKQTLLAMNQLFDIARSVAKQLSLHESINNPIILKTFTEKNINLLEIPDNTLFNDILYDTHHNIKKLLIHMYKITSALEFLHNNNIAVGDIDLANLFILHGKLVLAKFESFNTINSTKKQNSKIIISNSCNHAPEIRIPFTENDHNYYNTEATTSSDIYSLGTLFADMLYLFASRSSFSINDLIQDDTFYSIGVLDNKKINLICFNRYPDWLISRLQAKIPICIFNLFYSYKHFVGYYFRHLPENEDNADILKELTNIINQCNQPNPAARPTATKVKNMLDNLLYIWQVKTLGLPTATSIDTKLKLN